MKKFFALAAAALMAMACYDDAPLNERLSAVESDIEQIQNTLKTLTGDVSALQSLVSGKLFITDVKTEEDGSVTVFFVDAAGNQSVKTIPAGKDGNHGSVVGVKKDTDGIWYWSINGEFALADGKKIPVTGNDGQPGAKPEFKIEGGMWYVSYDKKQTWTEIGPAVADSLIASVTPSEDGAYAVIELVDGGTRLTFPIMKAFALNVTEAPKFIKAGETASVKYELTGADAETEVEALASGRWKAEVDAASCTVEITAPEDELDGKVVLIAVNGQGRSAMRTVSFCSGAVYVVDDVLTVPAAGGDFNITLSTNIDVTAQIPEGCDWISIPATKAAALRFETFAIAVSANTEAGPRAAVLSLAYGEYIVKTVLVRQLGTDPTSMVLGIKVGSATDLSFTIPASSSATAAGDKGDDVDIFVDWGDGKTDEYFYRKSSWADCPSHKYAEAGDYMVTISGIIPRFGNFTSSDVQKANMACIHEVIQWGNLHTKMFNSALAYSSVEKVPSTNGQPTFTAATNMSMFFEGCKNLKEIEPTLLETATSATAFGGFFSGTLLTGEEIPETFFSKCVAATAFNSLFRSCPNIKTVPEGLFRGLPKVSNISQMFDSSSIESVPAGLFSGLSTVTNVASVFASCPNLKSIPYGLFEDLTAVTSSGSLFKNDPQLKDFPSLKAFTLVTNFSNLFEGCSFEAVPDILPAKTGLMSSIGSMFLNCKNLKEIPEGLFDFVEWKSGSNVTTGIFEGCESLKTVPAGLFAPFKSAKQFTKQFINCTSLESVPAGLLDGFTACTSFAYFFQGCENLETVPYDLFKDCTALTTVTGMFTGCAKLAAAPSFKNSPVAYFTELFNGCASLTEAPDIFGTTKVNTTSIASVFKGCAGIKSIPEGYFDFINEGKLTTATSTFEGCTSLESLPANLFDNHLALKTITSMCKGCEKLATETPYIIKEVAQEDGSTASVKYHLYERNVGNKTLLGLVNTVSAADEAFAGCVLLPDYDSVPSNWKNYKQ